jgi:hypothetical protein
MTLNPYFVGDIQNTSRRTTSLEEGQKELKDGADQLRINQEQQGGMWVLNMCYTHCTGFSLGTSHQPICLVQLLFWPVKWTFNNVF